MTTNEPAQQENVGPQHPDPDDALDVIPIFSPAEGSGYWRDIELREGLKLLIGDFQMRDRLLATHPAWEADWLEYHFHFSGIHQNEHACVSARQFAFTGTGLAPRETWDFLEAQPYLEVQIHINPETLRSFTGGHRCSAASYLAWSLDGFSQPLPSLPVSDGGESRYLAALGHQYSIELS